MNSFTALRNLDPIVKGYAPYSYLESEEDSSSKDGNGTDVGGMNFWKRCCLVKMTVFQKMEVVMMKVKRKVLKIIQ